MGATQGCLSSLAQLGNSCPEEAASIPFPMGAEQGLRSWESKGCFAEPASILPLRS